MNQGTRLTVNQVSSKLFLSPSTVRRLSDRGVIKCYRVGPRGDRRYNPKDIKELEVCTK
jgi:DNA-binding transcriptional MerR regulator